MVERGKENGRAKLVGMPEAYNIMETILATSIQIFRQKKSPAEVVKTPVSPPPQNTPLTTLTSAGNSPASHKDLVAGVSAVFLGGSLRGPWWSLGGLGRSVNGLEVTLERP